MQTAWLAQQFRGTFALITAPDSILRPYRFEGEKVEESRIIDAAWQVSPKTIRDIWNRRTWGHATASLPAPDSAAAAAAASDEELRPDSEAGFAAALDLPAPVSLKVHEKCAFAHKACVRGSHQSLVFANGRSRQRLQPHPDSAENCSRTIGFVSS